MVREKKAIGTFCIKCSDGPQVFVMAKVHAARHRMRGSPPVEARMLTVYASEVCQPWVRQQKAKNLEITRVVP